jgi:hypothetical protein
MAAGPVRQLAVWVEAACQRCSCVQQPAGLARPASNFLLLAQKKVTKEESPNTISPSISIEKAADAGRCNSHRQHARPWM